MLLSDILIVLLIVVFIGLVFWAVPTSYFILFTVLLTTGALPDKPAIIIPPHHHT